MDVSAPSPAIETPKRKREPRARGMGRVFQRGGVWWLAYYHRGTEHRESSGSLVRKDAVDKLKARLGEMGHGRLIGPSAERVTFDDLARDFLADFRLKGRRSIEWAEDRVVVLRRTFDGDRAVDITGPRLRAFAEARLTDGASAATVNRDLAVLRRMFTLAVQAERLQTRPHFPALKEAEPRRDFFEAAEYAALRERLPDYVRDVLDFGYHTGWRKGEILGLGWADLDRAAGVIRLPAERSKNGRGRVLALSPQLRALIERRWQGRALGCPFVFHRDGERIADFRKAWRAACRGAGLTGKLFHGLRRTAVRNLVRAGVGERVAMSVTGHVTRAVFDRYNIVSEADIRQATTRLGDYVDAQAATSPTVIPLPATARA